MKVNVTSNINAAQILRSRGLGTNNDTRLILASEIVRLSDPYVPMQQGTLKNTVQIAADGSEIVCNQPYAHYQYYGEVMAGRAPKHYTGRAIRYHGAPLRGKEWDKRMMIDRGREVAEAVAKRVGGKAK